MKIKTEVHDHELEVPKIIEDDFKLAKQEGLKENSEDYDKEFWEQPDEESFAEWFSYDILGNYLEKYNGKIIDIELALFLSFYESDVDIGSGGHNYDDSITFEDNGFKYTILIFAPYGRGEDDNSGFFKLGYKEKIE